MNVPALRAIRLPALLWGVVAVISIAYAPLAFEALWSYFSPHPLNLGLHLLGDATGPKFAYGPGSGAVHEAATYPHSRWWLLIHTTCASVALTLATFQFSGRLRAWRPALHRTVGKVTMVLTLVSMVGAIGYLWRTPPRQVFSGVPFSWALWGIAFGMIGITVWSFLAIRRGDVRTHQRLNYLGYALLMTAPVLRIEWVVLHGLLPGADHATVNLVSSLSLAPIVMTGAIIATRISDRATSPSIADKLAIGPRAEGAAFIVGALGLAWLSLRYTHYAGRPDVFLIDGLVVPGTAMWLAYGWLGARARRAGNLVAAAEWRVHFLALTTAPIYVAALWLVASTHFLPIEGFLAAANVGWPMAMSTGYIFITLRRRRPATQGARGSRPRHGESRSAPVAPARSRSAGRPGRGRYARL
jgi:hypothetical protein